MRVFYFVLDSVGIGNAPDAAAFGDDGADTVGHIADAIDHFSLPNLESLGLGVIKRHNKIKAVKNPHSVVASMIELSNSKDTSAGHWEMMGVTLTQEFAHYDKHGFPPEIMRRFEQITQRGWIGNCAASGTEIIARLGEEHQKSGRFIVYTSADSVFQIAAHTDTVPLEELYEVCEKTRSMLDEYRVLRVIARPFTGQPGAYERLNAKRHDYSMPPPESTYLEALRGEGVSVIGVGKIPDIFAHRGIDSAVYTDSNIDGMRKTEQLLDSAPDRSFVFVNLVEFDAVYGHRRNVVGYYEALRQFDDFLPGFMRQMRSDDYLFITADHGCDPTFPGSDHTREQVPLLLWSPSISSFENRHEVTGFMHAGNAVKHIFGVR